MFDIKSYLEERQISFRTAGKNVTKDHIEINCVFCDDPSEHLGIHLTRDVFNCWRCGEKGHIRKILQKIEKCFNVDNIISKFNIGVEENEDESNGRYKTINNLHFPSNFSKTFPTAYLKYLSSRGYDPEYTIKKYDLYCTNHLGKLKFRIIAPVYYNGKLVNYVARSIKDNARRRYEVCQNEKAVIPLKHCVYNIDNTIYDNVIIVEGVTDVWKLGDGVIATFGINYTAEQLKVIMDKKFKKVFILYDNDSRAYIQADRLGAALSTFVDVEILTGYGTEDPSSMNEETVEYVRSHFLQS